jgi:hypothetical protein
MRLQSGRGVVWFISLALGLLCGAAPALAQPAATDLGTLTNPQFVSHSVTFSTQGQVQWYRFVLAAPVAAPGTFLDIRTTSSVVPPVNVDTMIGLYSATGARIATDDEDGPSSFSALSFGAVCAARPNNAASPLGGGLPFDGRDGTSLAAGTYYLAVSGFNTTFGPTNWTVTTQHNQTGNVTTEINLGMAQPSAALFTAGGATPSPVTAGQPLLITATLASNCPSALAGVFVTVDLTTVGGDAETVMFDDGPAGGHGDAVAGDNTYSLSYTVPPTTATGSYAVVATSNNSNGLTDTRTINFSVQGPPAVLTPVGGVYGEVEDNDNKPRANIINAMASGEAISGTTTGTSTVTPGSSSADYYRLTTAQGALGIYKHQLALTSPTAGHTASIRGLSQSNGNIATGTDVFAQTSTATTTPARMVQWYGFGRGETIYYRVTGTGATTAPYMATLTDAPVTPVQLGNFAVGQVTISTFNQGHTTDTDMWLYDGAFTAIPMGGNDDEVVANGGSGLTNQSILRRTLTQGTYYLALSNWNVCNDQPSPPDDNFRSGNVLDFPNAILQSDISTTANLAFTLTDGAGPHPFAATKPGAFGIYWAAFSVGVTPPTCGSADFDCDGDSGTDADIEAFFACIAGSCPAAPCASTADFNMDGDSGTDADIESFFRVLAGGPC